MRLISHLIAAVLVACTPALASDPLDTVKQVDLKAYLGKWYEVARIEHKFQKGCYNSTAEYSFREDGDIKVVNSCDVVGKGTRKEATGRAWVVDPETNAKLRVQFFLTGIKLKFLSGNYWILDLAEDYSYVLVGDPSREYFWILSRTPDLTDDLLNNLLKKAEELGYDRTKILLNRDLRP